MQTNRREFLKAGSALVVSFSFAGSAAGAALRAPSAFLAIEFVVTNATVGCGDRRVLCEAKEGGPAYRGRWRRAAAHDEFARRLLPVDAGRDRSCAGRGP